MTIKKIAVVTASRAEYGLLKPVIKRITEDDELELQLIVSGGHLSEKQGLTIKEIRHDGFIIAKEIPILEDDNTPYGVSLTMANAINGFANYFRFDRPNMLIILGDRTEMLGVAVAAMNERIPIAHIHGGEVTEGAVDDQIRHALTKMSYLHFTSCDAYRRRVIQLGESPERVFNVGALGVENILCTPLMSDKEIRIDIGIPEVLPYAVVTFHPVTLEHGCEANQIGQLCEAMKRVGDIFYVITSANADTGGDDINRILREYANRNPQKAVFVESLGMIRYLSAVKYASFVLGNSSSGVLEAPALHTPTVNIGNRQKGRIMPKSVISCPAETDAIEQAVRLASSTRFHEQIKKIPNPYGDGNASRIILSEIKRALEHGIQMKKMFFDLKSTE